MTLSIRCPHASEAELDFGIKAALAIFRGHGRTPEYCDEQMRKLSEGEDYDSAAVQTWHDAEYEGLKACCMDWVKIPDEAYLEFID